jgi:energy-coupling factor transport system permease protein
MRGPLFTAENARPWLARLDPRVKIAWVFAVSVVAVTVDGLRDLSFVAAAAAVAATGLRLRSRGWAAILGIIALSVWGTMLTQGLFYIGDARTPLLTIVAPSPDDPLTSGLVLSYEGMRYGAVQSLRLIAASLAGFTASLSTSPERMLGTLARLRLPVALAFMTTAALRFLPLVVEEAAVVRRARRWRGYRFTLVGPRGDRFAPYRVEFGLLFPVIASSLRRAETLAESITARGFDPSAPRTFFPPLQMTGRERAIVALLAIICLAVIARKFLPMIGG